MSDISNTRQLTMTTAVRRVNEAKQRAVGMLKSDRFLADANWDYVDKKTEIDDPYRFEDYHFEVGLWNYISALCYYISEEIGHKLKM